jgi:hypothetical protein
VELPTQWGDFFQHQGVLPREYSDRRKFPRLYLREKALMRRGERLGTVLTADISQDGLSLLHSEQLFPGDHVNLWRSCGAELNLVVVRCMRIARHCYECGLQSHTDQDKLACAELVREILRTAPCV